jgi:hypothetical protein
MQTINNDFVIVGLIIVSLVALVVSSVAITGHINFRDNSIEASALKVDDGFEYAIIAAGELPGFSAISNTEDEGLAATTSKINLTQADLSHLSGHSAEALLSGAHVVVDTKGLAFKSGDDKYLKITAQPDANYSLKFPDTTGTANQVLRLTDPATGQLEFRDQSVSTDNITNGNNALDITIPNSISLNSSNGDINIGTNGDRTINIGNNNTEVSINERLSITGCNINSNSSVVTIGDSSLYAKNIKNKNISSFKWNQIGVDINGVNTELLGYSVSLNHNGDILAIGSPYDDVNGLNSGSVKVYKWNGSAWSQMGSNLNGSADDTKGAYVSLSSSGDILAVGSPFSINTLGNFKAGKVNVYKWSGVSWLDYGSTLYGDNAYDEFGHYISLGADGKVLAVGAPNPKPNGAEPGKAKIYKWDGSNWGTPIVIDGNEVREQFGCSVALSYDGDVLAVGAPYNNSSAGLVRVYKFYDGIWNLKQTIQDGATGDLMGLTVSLSSDGDVLAVGSPHGSPNSTHQSGITKVYKWNGTSWNKIGTDIDGTDVGDKSGMNVSLNAYGDVLAVGIPQTENTSTKGGITKIYKFNGYDWDLINTILGTDPEQSGTSVSLNSDGNIVVTGAPYADSNTGKVEVHGLGEYFSNITTRDIYSLRRPVTDAYYDSFANIILEDNDPHIQLISNVQGTASSMIVWTVVDTQDFDDKNFYNRNWAMDMKTDGQLRWIYKANEKASGDLVVPDSAKGIHDVMREYSEKLILEPNGRMQLSGDATTTVSGPTVDPNDPLVLLKLHRTDATGVESWLVDKQFSWGFRVDAAKFHIVRDINAKSVKMTFDNENVGIGVTTPTSMLHINSNKNVQTSGTDDGGIKIIESGSNFSLVLDTNQIEQFNDSLYLNSKSGGNVIIGTGSASGRLTVTGYVLKNMGSFGFFNNTGGGGTSSGSANLSIYTEHDISSGILYARSLNAGSDDRLKIEEEYISDATSTIMKLKPQKYYKKNKLDSQFQAELDDWNAEKAELQVKIDEIQLIEDRTLEQVEELTKYKTKLEELENKEPVNKLLYESGLIAQEVFYDAPELRHIVSTGFDPGEISDTPPEGYGNADPTVDPDYSNWGVSPASLNYIGLIPYLIKSIQEQQELIVSQQTTINDLLSRVSALENS